MEVGLRWTPALSKENDPPVSTGLTGAHSGIRSPKVPLRDVLRRQLKKEKTKRGPASWLMQAVPVPAELPQDPPQSTQACLHTMHPHGRGCGQVGIGRDPPPCPPHAGQAPLTWPSSPSLSSRPPASWPGSWQRPRWPSSAPAVPCGRAPGSTRQQVCGWPAVKPASPLLLGHLPLSHGAL